MIFDAIINLFKTICIGAIAFSPLLVYKLTEEPTSNNYNTEVSNQQEFQGSESKNENQVVPSTDNSQTGVFKNSNFFASGGIAPPPPQGEDVPIDNQLWILIVLGIGYGFWKYKMASKTRDAQPTIL